VSRRPPLLHRRFDRASALIEEPPLRNSAIGSLAVWPDCARERSGTADRQSVPMKRSILPYTGSIESDRASMPAGDRYHARCMSSDPNMLPERWSPNRASATAWAIGSPTESLCACASRARAAPSARESESWHRRHSFRLESECRHDRDGFRRLCFREMNGPQLRAGRISTIQSSPPVGTIDGHQRSRGGKPAGAITHGPALWARAVIHPWRDPFPRIMAEFPESDGCDKPGAAIRHLNREISSGTM